MSFINTGGHMVGYKTPMERWWDARGGREAWGEDVFGGGRAPTAEELARYYGFGEGKADAFAPSLEHYGELLEQADPSFWGEYRSGLREHAMPGILGELGKARGQAASSGFAGAGAAWEGPTGLLGAAELSGQAKLYDIEQDVTGKWESAQAGLRNIWSRWQDIATQLEQTK